MRKLLLAFAIITAPTHAQNVDPISEAATEITRRFDAIESRLGVMESKPAPKPSPALPPAPKPLPALPLAPKPQPVKQTASKPQPVKQTVNVCASGCDAITLKAAYALVAEGGRIEIRPGVYEVSGDLVIKKPLTIFGMGAHLKGVAKSGADKINFDKAILAAEAPNVRIEGLEISEVRSSSGNGACIRIGHAVKNIEIINVNCHDAQMGVLGKLDNGDVLIEGSTIGETASGSANPHVIYITKANKFTLRNSTLHSTPAGRRVREGGLKSIGGHLVKTGARETLIEGCVLAALDTKAARAVDAFAGGNVTIRNNAIQGRNNENTHFIAYGVENKRLGAGPHNLLVEGNTFIVDDARAWHVLRPAAPLVAPYTANVRGNRIVGKAGVAGWAAAVENITFADRSAAGLPVYDGTIGSVRLWPF